MPTTKAHWLRVVVAMGCAAGLLLSPKLWLTGRAYPFTPVASFLAPIPQRWDLAAYVVMLVLLLAIAAVERPRVPIAAFLVLALTLALQDQSRWQPWFYQYLLMLIALAFSEGSDICRLIMVAIYIWSGLSKFNPEFIHSTLPSMVKAHWLAQTVAIAIPLIETSIGVGLFTRRFRKVAVAAAILMHVLILMMIGPFWQNHNTVVWPWNVAMIVLVQMLFDGEEPVSRNFAVLLLVGVAPAFSFAGYWDSYLSFALYSGNSTSGEIFFNDATYERLPAKLQDYVYDVSPDLNRLSISDWSYGELNVPSYPERRIFLNVTRRVCSLIDTTPDVYLMVKDRFGHSYRDTCGSVNFTSPAWPE